MTALDSKSVYTSDLTTWKFSYFVIIVWVVSCRRFLKAFDKKVLNIFYFRCCWKTFFVTIYLE